MDLGPSRKGSDIEARQPAWAFAVNCPNTFDESAFLRRLRDVQPKTESTAPNLELQAKTISKDEYENDQYYYSMDTKELLKAFDKDSYRSLGQAVYVSKLSSLDIATAPAFLNDLRSILELFHLDEGYLSTLYDMGHFSSRAFTCHSFRATVSQESQYTDSGKSQEVMKLWYTLKTICNHNAPLTWSLENVKVFHQLDRTMNRALWLVMEDSWTSFQETSGIGESYSFGNQYNVDRLLRVSVLETARYCEMALRGWWIALDEIEERIWTATVNFSSNETQNFEANITSDTNLKLQTLLIAVEGNLTTFLAIKDAYSHLRHGLIAGEIFSSMISHLNVRQKRIKQLLMLNENLVTLYTNQWRLREQATQLQVTENLLEMRSIAFGTAKLNYLSQNYLRGTAYLVVLFLPGIFVSALITSGVFGDLSSSTYLQIWLAFALPFTFLSVALLQFLWVEPIFWDNAKEYLNARGMPVTVHQVFTKFREPQAWEDKVRNARSRYPVSGESPQDTSAP